MPDHKYTQKNHDQLKTKKKKKHKGLIVLLVVLLVLAAALGAFAIWFVRLYSLTRYVSDLQVARDLSERNTASVASGELSGEQAEMIRASVGGSGSGDVILPVNKDIYNLLLVGVDRRDSSWAGNSDSMILVSVNNKNKIVHMISFMRDLYADIPGYGVGKLNAACAHGGCPLLVQTIEENYGVNIDNYVSVDFAGLIHIIDAMGGVQIELTDEARESVVDGGYDPAFGARPLKRYIQKNVETLAARKILEGSVLQGQTILIGCSGGSLTAEVR